VALFLMLAPIDTETALYGHPLPLTQIVKLRTNLPVCDNEQASTAIS
jgi:hypothetical protein